MSNTAVTHSTKANHLATVTFFTNGKAVRQADTVAFASDDTARHLDTARCDELAAKALTEWATWDSAAVTWAATNGVAL